MEANRFELPMLQCAHFSARGRCCEPIQITQGIAAIVFVTFGGFGQRAFKSSIVFGSGTNPGSSLLPP
jgi:hypothetical protein